ncbi:MAG: PAAR domain-containing protein, partial [Planctomyces sp.]
GSASVLIGGRPALRAGDTCGCGASVAVGCPTVSFG